MTASFEASVFTATSLDGYLARAGGSLDWLMDRDVPPESTGWNAFFEPIDAVVVGRATYDAAAGVEPWPFAGKRVLVLSHSFDELPQPNTSVRHDLTDIVETLEREGRTRVYVDGGQAITEFLHAGLVTDITLTVAPVLIGGGIRLFGRLTSDIDLTLLEVRDLGSGFTQSRYEVVRDSV
ncbi:dihydrofolate reductase family protein [Okibacterium endophyticum]